MYYTVYGLLQARILQWVAFPFSKGSSQPRDQVFHISGDSLLAEPQGKPKDTGAGILSLLQGIFLIQELNQGLLHCRRVLNQLSYQRSPKEVPLNYNFFFFDQVEAETIIDAREVFSL